MSSHLQKSLADGAQAKATYQWLCLVVVAVGDFFQSHDHLLPEGVRLEPTSPPVPECQPQHPRVRGSQVGLSRKAEEVKNLRSLCIAPDDTLCRSGTRHRFDLIAQSDALNFTGDAERVSSTRLTSPPGVP